MTFKEKIKKAFKSEEGASLVELIISIPILTLILGTVLVSMAVTFGLQSSIGTSSKVASVTEDVMNELSSTVTTCSFLNSKMAEINNRSTYGQYRPNLTFSSTCVTNGSAIVNIKINDTYNGNKLMNATPTTILTRS